MTTTRTQTLMAVAALIAALAFLTPVALAADPVTALGAGPLPSWNDGAAKKSVVEFVAKVTKEGGLDFVPPAERVAVFDNDGTLWAEQPIYFQFAFALDRVKAFAAQRANPASQHYVEEGGTHSIDHNSGGGQYGVCIFPDNHQCEEWVLFRGECRPGGIRVTGYATLAALGPLAQNPQGPADSIDPSEPGVKKKVHKGGSFLYTDQYCARYIAGGRGKGEPDTGTNHVGFRMVREVG